MNGKKSDPREKSIDLFALFFRVLEFCYNRVDSASFHSSEEVIRMAVEIKLEDCAPPGVNIRDTNFGYTLSLIGGKHKLSNALKEMEACGLIERVEYPQIPPKVE